MSDWINDRTTRPDAAAGRRAATRAAGWRLVVPVKGGPDAKSRLRPPEGIDRLDLARALALDTVAAAVEAVGAAQVVVVTGDAEMAQDVARLGAQSVPDPGAGLNAALRAGLVQAGPPSRDTGVAVLLGDLPAVRASELVAALAAVPVDGSGFVPDAEGTGTVLLAARGSARLEPRFGAGSARAHADDGHEPLPVEAPGLRRDVDDEGSLREALGLGVGAHTARLLAHLIGAPPRHPSPRTTDRSEGTP